MSPRQARRERREAVRKAKKLALKKSRLAENQPRPAASDLADRIPLLNPSNKELTNKERSRDREEVRRQAPSQSKETGFVSQRPTEVDRAAINRANAQHSTGPRSANGKLASSRNSTKHGLASGTLLIPGEDPAAFEALLNDLLSEHQPTSSTARLLVAEMAQSYWLAQRAIRLQNTCFTEEGINEKHLALFLRYQTTHERRFYKALNCLIQSKKEAARKDRGFVSQRAADPVGPIGFVSQAPPSSAIDILPDDQKTAQAA